jgi:hypothetical protein
LAFLAGGCLLILSLIKPLVAPPGQTTEPHYLDRRQESLLFAFVKELASACGMPKPSRIAADCTVNCCCVFAGGIGGLFRPGLVLQVGLPLAASLRLDEFGGVLAHELAHAAQTVAMRSSRVLFGVHAWFSRVAFERDEIDEQVLRWLEKAGPVTRPILRLALALFKPGRGVLRLLMIAECAGTSFFLRLMEAEADRHQARVAGSAAFVSAIMEVNLLALAAQRAVVELARMKRCGRLVDNYPGLISALRSRYSLEFVQRIMAGFERGKTSWLSAHPGDKDRIALARAEKARGIFTAGMPAAVLFADFEALCRSVTLEFYDQELRVQREGCELVPLPSVLEELEWVP